VRLFLLLLAMAAAAQCIPGATAAAVRTIELRPGTLVGFKTAPGPSCERLFAHSQSMHDGTDAKESPEPDWSGIYVQLDIDQAVRYVPNQFDRGEPEVCIVALRVREGQLLRVVVCDDPRMSDTAVSSADKAGLVRSQVFEEGGAGAPAPPACTPLLAALGQRHLALCLIDSEDYELAVPHALFSEVLFEAETVLHFRESTRMPSTIGHVAGQGSVAEAAVQAVTKTMSKGDLSDASALSALLSASMASHDLEFKVGWLTGDITTLAGEAQEEADSTKTGNLDKGGMFEYCEHDAADALDNLQLGL